MNSTLPPTRANLGDFIEAVHSKLVTSIAAFIALTAFGYFDSLQDSLPRQVDFDDVQASVASSN